MLILHIILVLLVIIILFLSLALYFFSKKTNYYSKKEKEFIVFVIDIFIEFGDDLGIQSKEQYNKVVDELNKIKNKLLNNKGVD